MLINTCSKLYVKCLTSQLIFSLDSLVFYFFFQAEDGIRDWSVTGVQTCALPISLSMPSLGSPTCWSPTRRASAQKRQRSRSEERRVGKECRSRWSAYH